MSRDLRAQLAEYGQQLRDDLPVLSPDEVSLRGESSIVVGSWDDRPSTTRGHGVLVVAAAFLVVGLAGLFQFLAPPPSEVADTQVAPLSEFGVFEPIRGWIIYPILGGDLKAVNPDNPSQRRTLDLPEEAAWSVPVGWSADGSLLALEDEKNGHWTVMDRFGELPFHGPAAGCCLFVTSNWLSPDGASTFRYSADGGLLAIDPLAGGEPLLLDLDQLDGMTGWRETTWSPDSSEIAAAAELSSGMEMILIEVDTGAIRKLPDSTFEYVRHVAWSPDGTQLLVTAADLTPHERENQTNNPLISPIPSRLYLVNLDGSGRREIAAGYYVATAWSPDGTQIAALSTKGRTVVVMNADGSGQTVLPDVTPYGPFTGIAWHPVP